MKRFPSGSYIEGPVCAGGLYAYLFSLGVRGIEFSQSPSGAAIGRTSVVIIPLEET